MLTIRAAKTLHGRLDLPPSPDCWLLATVTAIARNRPVRIIPACNVPIVQEWAGALSDCASIQLIDNEWIVKPAISSASQCRVVFPTTDLPYRDLVVFTLLGMGITIEFGSISEKRSVFWQEQTKRLGRTLLIEPKASTSSSAASLRISESAETATPCPEVEDRDVEPLLGLLLGCGANSVFKVNSTVVSPLRTIAPVFGCRIEVKSSVVRERNEVARRLQIMKLKTQRAEAGQKFVVNADFSLKKDVSSEEQLTVTLPGDELGGALFTAAKCLFPKSSLVIGNHPIETWATPLAIFVRKMGCKVSLQQTASTSFGATGMLHVQTVSLSGRRMECVPAGQFYRFLPTMAVIASFADGETVFRGLCDLRLDEPDSVKMIESCIEHLGARHGEMPDGMIIKGDRNHDGFDLTEPLPASYAAAFAIAGLRCIGTTSVNDELLRKRLPQFEEMLNMVCEQRK